MDVLYGMMLVSFSRTSIEGQECNDILVGQIFYVILSMMSIGKVLLLLLTDQRVPLDSASFRRQNCMSQHSFSKNQAGLMKHLFSSDAEDVDRFPRQMIRKKPNEFGEYVLARYTENRWAGWLFRNIRKKRRYDR